MSRQLLERIEAYLSSGMPAPGSNVSTQLACTRMVEPVVYLSVLSVRLRRMEAHHDESDRDQVMILLDKLIEDETVINLPDKINCLTGLGEGDFLKMIACVRLELRKIIGLFNIDTVQNSRLTKIIENFKNIPLPTPQPALTQLASARKKGT